MLSVLALVSCVPYFGKNMPMGNKFNMPMGNKFNMPMGNKFNILMGNKFKWHLKEDVGLFSKDGPIFGGRDFGCCNLLLYTNAANTC